MGPLAKTVRFALLVWLALPAAALAAPPAVATKWRLTGQAQQNCSIQAAAAIFQAGFTSAEAASQSQIGRRGDYTASIRCVSEQRIVFFVVSGPDMREVAQLIDRLYERF